MQKELFKSIREKNRILNQWEQYYRKDKLQSFPITIQFPTGTRCNIHCKFCNHGPTGDFKDMSFEEFRSIIEKRGFKVFFNVIHSLALYGWGEPLFNRDYEKIFDYTVDNFPYLGIGICTNGILFDRKWSEKIIPVNNSDVNFSVNAATKETFYKLTGSKQFDRVIANIRTLTGLREKYRTKNPLVSLSFVATTENIRELPQFVDLAADLGADAVLVQDIMIFTKETEKLSLMNSADLAYRYHRMAKKQAEKKKIALSSFITHQVNYFLQDSEPLMEQQDYCQINAGDNNDKVPSPYFSNTDCFDPWEKIMIDEDGYIIPCCRFKALPETSLGNIHKQVLKDIWNGDAYRYLRRTINTDNPPPECAACPRKTGLD